MISIYASSAGASFIYVGLKAMQQLNVVHHQVTWVLPVSIGLGLCEVFIVGVIAVAAVQAVGFWAMALLGVSLGLGGGIGAIFSMCIHKRLRR